MEISDGEPDVIRSKNIDGTIAFIDYSPENSKERRSLCYDKNTLEYSRKQHKSENNAYDIAAEMGIGLLTEEQYRWFKPMEFLTPKPPFGSKLLKTSAGSVVPFLAITAMALFLFITMGQNLITLLEASEEFFGYDDKTENMGLKTKTLFFFPC